MSIVMYKMVLSKREKFEGYNPPITSTLLFPPQYITAVDRGAGFSIQGDHRAGFGRFYFVLHLHGFDYQETVAGRHFGARGNQHADDFTGHRCDDPGRHVAVNARGARTIETPGIS